MVVPLTHLMVSDRPEHLAVSMGRDGVVDWGQFRRRVAGLAHLLAPAGPGRWLIFADDPSAFATALIAVWQVGGVAVIAPNGQPGTLAILRGNTHGLISDREPSGKADPGRIAAVQPDADPTWSWRVVAASAPTLDMFTSGTTGPAKPVHKTLGHLETEIAGLERIWGSRLQGRQVFATVSAQHIYGLLFRVLWPLAAGRAFRSETFLHGEDLATSMGHAPSSYLVTTPSFLERACRPGVGSRLAPHGGPVFSSGGPLEAHTAIGLAEVLGAAPVEVFGSTETGGVAWRQRQPGAPDPAWVPLDGVSVDADPSTGLLRVHSPFVSAPDSRFVMANAVELLSNRRFRIGPRVDRVVKVGEKRLDLGDMEAALRPHPFVSDVTLLAVGGPRGERLGAVVALTPAGQDACARGGRRAVCRALTRQLEPYWDRVLLPRAWRFVSRLPENAQGKVTAASLLMLFATPYDPGITQPQLVAESVTESAVEQTLLVPKTLGLLDGHFPEFPVVPGVVQLQWVVAAARALDAAIGTALWVKRLESVKFAALLRPGDVFQLRVERLPSPRHLAFRLWGDRGPFSSGRCIVAEEHGEAP